MYLIWVDDYFILVDTAATSQDVIDYILPALNDFNVLDCQLKYIFLTHCHGDHSGGLKNLKEIFQRVH